MVDIHWLYDERYEGIKLVALNEQAQLQTVGQDGGGSVEFMKKGNWVTLTGYYCWHTSPDNLYFQTTLGNWYAIVNKTDWRNAGTVTLPHYSRDEVQAMIDAMLANDRRIVENSLFCARYADKLTAKEKKAVVTLQRRVMERQDALKSQGLVKDIKYAQTEGYAEFAPYLEKLMNSGIGFAWAAFIVWCFVLGATAAACYFVYRDFFAQSKDDVKWSDELTRTLKNKLTDEEYAQLERETQGIITKVSIRERFKGGLNTLTIAALIVGAALVVRIFKE